MPFGRPPISPDSLESHFEPLGHLIAGVGNFNAGVLIVRRRLDGKKFVEKRMEPEDILNGSAEFEMFIHRELNHRNIIKYLDAFIVDNGRQTPKASLYMEYCEHGTLEDHIQKLIRTHKYGPAARCIGEASIWSLFKQLANALTYLQHGIQDAVSAIHSHDRRASTWVGVAHRDIKPANIFLRRRSDGDEDIFPNVVLGDFGQAIRQDDLGHWDRLITGGDPHWAAPETRTFGYEYFADVWAVGAVIQAACRLENESVPVGPNPQARGRVYWGVGAIYSRELDDIVEHMMCPDPRYRPEMWELAPQLEWWSRRALEGCIEQRY